MSQKNQQSSANNSTDVSPDRFILYFNHIPKTAGTSLTIWLKSNFDASEVAPEWLFDADRKIELATSGMQMIAGHHASSVKGDGCAGFHEIIWIRDPLQWIRSFYRYAMKRTREAKASGNWKNGASKYIPEMSYEEFIRDRCGQGGEFIGYQCRWIYSDVVPPPVDDLSAEARLEKAMERIRDCVMVGTVGHMQESVDLLCFRLNWPPVDFKFRENVAAGEFDPAAADEEGFLRNNPDIALYEALDKKVCEDFSEMAISLGCAGATAGSERLHNALTRHFCRHGHPVFHRETASRGVSMFGKGWGGAFMWGEHRPRMIRWAQLSRRSEVFIPIIGAIDHHVELDVLLYCFPLEKGALTLEVNGKQIEYATTAHADIDYEHAVRLSAVIPASDIDESLRFLLMVIEVSEDSFSHAASINPDMPITFATDEIRVLRS